MKVKTSGVPNHANPPHNTLRTNDAGVSVMKYGLQSQAILLVREIDYFVLSRSISAYAE